MFVFALFMLVACSEGEAEPSDVATPAVEAGAPAKLSAKSSARMGSGPCAHVSVDDVTKVMGHPMQFGEATQEGECLLVSSTGDVTISVSILVQPSTALYDHMAGSDGAEQVSGIGENAVVFDLGVSSMVSARKDGHSYLAAVYNVARQTEVRAQALGVARSVVDRM